MFILLYTCFVTPVEIVFIDDQIYALLAFDAIIATVLVTDILISFNSAYYDDMGIIITSRRKIILNYIKTWFIVDLIMVMVYPLEYILDDFTD